MVNLVDIGAYLIDDLGKSVPLVSIAFVGLVVIMVAVAVVAKIFGRR